MFYQPLNTQPSMPTSFMKELEAFGLNPLDWSLASNTRNDSLEFELHHTRDNSFQLMGRWLESNDGCRTVDQISVFSL